MATMNFSSNPTAYLNRLFVLTSDFQKLPEEGAYQFPRGTICRLAAITMDKSGKTLRFVLREFESDMLVGSFGKPWLDRMTRLYEAPWVTPRTGVRSLGTGEFSDPLEQ
jgi:hypothetical protein